VKFPSSGKGKKWSLELGSYVTCISVESHEETMVGGHTEGDQHLTVWPEPSKFIMIILYSWRVLTPEQTGVVGHFQHTFLTSCCFQMKEGGPCGTTCSNLTTSFEVSLYLTTYCRWPSEDPTTQGDPVWNKDLNLCLISSGSWSSFYTVLRKTISAWVASRLK
jgi:hypothetical protein